MSDGGWGGIGPALRWLRAGVAVAIGLGGAWYGHRGQADLTPRMGAAIGRAFSEEAGFEVPRSYQVQPLRAGTTAFVIRPDGRRLPARTVQVGSLAHRLYVDLVAAGAEDPGPERGVQEAMDGLRNAYGSDLRPEDQLAVVPPGWGVRG